jgi:prepilin peptidase CpaA
MPHAWSATLVAAPTLLAASAVLVAACHDIIARTVPNRLAALIAALGLVARIADGHLIGGLIVAIVVFVAAALCWRRGWLGGGDVKLMGAAALALPPAHVAPFLVAMAIAGALHAAAYLALRHRVPAPAPHRPNGLLARTLRAESWRIQRGGPLPYACAIAAGFLFVVI